MSSTMPSPAQIAGEKRPAPLACLECRRKHLKCDANQPCSRCKTDRNECSYISSRRGYRGPQRSNGPDKVHLKGAVLDLSNTDPVPTSDSTSSIHSTPTTSATTLNDGLQTYMTGQFNPDPSSMSFDFLGPDLTPFSWQPSDRSGLMTAAARPQHDYNTNFPPVSRRPSQLTDLYYEYFHDAHPILLPRAHGKWLMNTPAYLHSVVELIGSHYSTDYNSDQLRSEVATSLQQSDDKSPAKVQALLLFSIALHAGNEQQEALDTIDAALDLAVGLGMNRRSFLASRYDQDPVVLESLRRTWWELYITNGWLAALHQWNSFKANTVASDMDLPCEEAEYASCNITSRPCTLLQLQNRVFVDEEFEISSFSYRIDAIQILGRVMSLENKNESNLNEVDAIDSVLSSWTHLLTHSKSAVMDCDGDVDEMLFQAHSIIHCASIYLHLPRSDLLPSPPTRADVDCARRMPVFAPSSSKHDHAVKASKAANALSMLAAFRTPVLKHTPFFICTLVLGAVVQLSACSVKACKCLSPYRDRIIQAVGLLKSLGRTWVIAWRVMRQIKRVATDVLQTGLQPEIKRLSEENPTNIEAILDDSLWVNSAGTAELLGNNTQMITL